MKMNSELRHRQSVLQAQLTSTTARKTDMEADLREKHKQIEHIQTLLDQARVRVCVCARACACACVCVCVCVGSPGIGWRPACLSFLISSSVRHS